VSRGLAGVTYTPQFYRTYEDESLRSAKFVVPLVMELTALKRVIDAGCGLGTWLGVFRENGVEEILGVDGDYVNRSFLHIPIERFLARDLSKPLDVPGGPYDLVLCMEVAEHLPQSRAASFISELASLGPVILFSAAIPCQGGDGHINEQWPGYWAEIFARSGFLAIDCIRPRIWDNEQVAYYYAQNSVLYVNRDRLDDYPLLRREYDKNPAFPRPLVHPRKWMEANDPRRQPLRPLLRALPYSLCNAAGLRLRKIYNKCCGGYAGKRGAPA
jgi:SAM-dependent methyltransferase